VSKYNIHPGYRDDLGGDIPVGKEFWYTEPVYQLSGSNGRFGMVLLSEPRYNPKIVAGAMVFVELVMIGFN
jgi:hypothetical protein